MHCKFHAGVAHVKGVDNDYADDLDRIPVHTFLSQGWRADLQIKFCLQDILCPERGRLFLPGSIDRAPVRLNKPKAWVNAQGA